MIRTITLSTLYPNRIQPRNGIFIEQRLRHLLKTGEVDSRVVAPVPWFPFRHPVFGRYAELARVPRSEERHGIAIRYPRYFLPPKVGLAGAALSMAAAARPVAARWLSEGYGFDAIDAYYLYPEGVAALLLGLWFGKPVVMTALGDDVITYPRYLLPRLQLRWAVKRAGGVTSVCQALKDRLGDWGAPTDKVRVVLHGVDLEMFRPVDREAARRRLGLEGRVLLSVGHAVERKGHHFAIEALLELPGTTLMIAGDGPWEGRLRELARRLGVERRVRLLGHVDQEGLPELYGAADALVLASSREGIANVLIESMACGTPVVATAVWGTPEAVNVPEVGVLLRDRSAAAVVEGVRRLFERYPDRAATRRHAETFRWERTSREHLEVLRGAIRQGAPAGGRRGVSPAELR
jgi:teichuronic acid biosynthesis glycosyltransferase TuaC